MHWNQHSHFHRIILALPKDPSAKAKVDKTYSLGRIVQTFDFIKSFLKVLNELNEYHKEFTKLYDYYCIAHHAKKNTFVFVDLLMF